MKENFTNPIRRGCECRESRYLSLNLPKTLLKAMPFESAYFPMKVAACIGQPRTYTGVIVLSSTVQAMRGASSRESTALKEPGFCRVGFLNLGR